MVTTKQRKPWTQYTLEEIWKWLFPPAIAQPKAIAKNPARLGDRPGTVPLPAPLPTPVPKLRSPLPPPPPAPVLPVLPDPAIDPGSDPAPKLSPRTSTKDPTVDPRVGKEHLSPRLQLIYQICDRTYKKKPGTTLEGYRQAVAKASGKPCGKDSVLRWKRSRELLSRDKAGGGKPGRRLSS